MGVEYSLSPMGSRFSKKREADSKKHNGNEFDNKENKDEGKIVGEKAKKQTNQKDIEIEPIVKPLPWNVKPPPDNGKVLHEVITEKITSTFSNLGYSLENDVDGPAVVTVVNASLNAQMDIERDKGSANLTASESENIIILRIKPTNDQNRRIEKIKHPGNILDLVFLSDQNNRALHDCAHNTEQLVRLLENFKIDASRLKTDAQRKIETKLIPPPRPALPPRTDAHAEDLNPKVSEVPAKLLSFNVKAAPANGKRLNEQILEKITEYVKNKGYRVKDDGEGPTLVTVVNAMQNVQIDIRRDVAAARLTSSESANVILLRIKPTRNPSQKVVKTKDHQLDLVFLSGQDNKTLHECEHNTEQCQLFM